MNDTQDQGRRSKQHVGPPPSQSALAYMALDSDGSHDSEYSTSPPTNGPMSAPPGFPSQLPERPNFPTRSSTTPLPRESDRRNAKSSEPGHSKSEDLNHVNGGHGSDHQDSDHGPGRSSAYLSSSRPATPTSSNNHNQQPVNGDRADSSTRRPRSIASDASLGSESSVTIATSQAPTHTSISTNAASCVACGKAMQGAFVRALGSVYHLNCFKCMDCSTVVASKFFPIDGPDGKQYPLCERDYFRRLNLICAKCGQALRASYITACNKKFHVEHFSCSVCPTLFGPQDSYYEHDGDVYCHFHYSTRFATKCVGCNTAILKQFVEINRNMRDECWHPECYMINKFWNVKIVSRRPNSGLLTENGEQPEPEYVDEERRENATSLRDKQIKMEQLVYRIWTVLSAFEESSAACISDMLRQVSNGQYLEAIRMAERFILHVEVLFATIDDLEFQFAQSNMKGMSHVREARMLCRKTVDLFTLLSHTQETGSRRVGMTQELLALVTGLAHYLKILIRIALTGALKLEREYGVSGAIDPFLDKLHMLAINESRPSTRRMVKAVESGVVLSKFERNSSTEGVVFGFKSLAPENAGESPFASSRDPALAKFTPASQPTDACARCKGTVEEDCVRLGTFQRWHSSCVQCATCGKVAAVPVPKEPAPPKSSEGGEDKEKEKSENGPKLSSARRPPANVNAFVYEIDSMKDTAEYGRIPTVVYCTEHGHAGCQGGFQAVSRLEQYAFLLNVALRRLYALLKTRGIIHASPSPAHSQTDLSRDPYRNSSEINRLKALDRKLSATARFPKRSTIVESPTGKVAHPHETHVHKDMSSQPRQPQTLQANRLHKHPPQQAQQQQRQRLEPPGPLNLDTQQQVIRPAFARSNTEVKIVDDSAPTSPAGGVEEPRLPEDGITLADIPQIVEAEQAREQHRSLPRQSSVPYIAELSPLELAIVKHAAVLVLQRSPLRDQFDLDEILELLEMKKSSFWNKLFKANNDKKGVKKKGVFGIPLELLVEREGADSLHGASRAPVRIPSFIDDVVSAMKQMDMSIEGIFRKNGNIRRLKELTDAIDRDPSTVDLTQDNPVQLAALLKKFLRELPDPLLTFKLHRLFIASQTLPNEAERKRLLHMVSLLLPKYHRDTMEVLFVFLKWVASFAHIDKETGSKMDLQNLATVICPSILYSRGRDAVRDESFGAIRVVTSLLENQDEFYLVPEEFLPILQDQDYFASSMELPSKDFLKKCDTYMRIKASGRNPGLMSPVNGPSSSPFGTPRPEDMRSLPPRTQSNPPQSVERPPMQGSAVSEAYLRNGTLSRHQSPPNAPGLTHAPFSYPAPGNSSIPSSLTPGMAPTNSIQVPQPRHPAANVHEQLNGNGNNDWNQPLERPPPISQSPGSRSRPSSYAPSSTLTPTTSRPSIDGGHPSYSTPNGYATPTAAQPQPVRQRI